MSNKPSKVLIIGAGPIIIGQNYCHSEGAERLKNLPTGADSSLPLRFAQGFGSE